LAKLEQESGMTDPAILAHCRADNLWLTCTDPTAMLEFLRGKASDRKLRLFACAFWRWQSGNLQDKERDTLRELVGRAERIADTGKWGKILQSQRILPLYKRAWDAAKKTANTSSEWKNISMSRLQCDLLRDIFGNPVRSITLKRAWLTHTVVSLSKAIYNDRTFDHLPIVGDALEEVGCVDAAILEHCRGPGPHARGCHVVDLILGKQ
jgi:hypothetical protein